MAEAERLIHLIAATAGGDQRAFRELYEATSPQMNALLVRMLRRRDWAEEALQDCFVKVWQKSESYSPDKGAPLTWLLTVARYRALDILRARRPEVSDTQGGSDDDDDDREDRQHADPRVDLHADAERGEEIAQLDRCMKTLQDEQRRSVLLAYYEGYTHPELADALKAPLGTVKSWVRRGLQRLRDCLDGVPA